MDKQERRCKACQFRELLNDVQELYNMSWYLVVDFYNVRYCYGQVEGRTKNTIFFTREVTQGKRVTLLVQYY